MKDAQFWVKGDEKLTSIFGRWPSFHDAVVETVQIERVGPTVTISFRLNELSASGLIHRVDATLRWHEVNQLEIKGVDEEENNWIWGLDLERTAEGVDTVLWQMDGIHGRIRSAGLEVLDVSGEPVAEGES